VSWPGAVRARRVRKFDRGHRTAFAAVTAIRLGLVVDSEVVRGVVVPVSRCSQRVRAPDAVLSFDQQSRVEWCFGLNREPQRHSFPPGREAGRRFGVQVVGSDHLVKLLGYHVAFSTSSEMSSNTR